MMKALKHFLYNNFCCPLADIAIAIDNNDLNMLGRVVSPLVNVIDVDGIVQRINVNELVERIDFNKLLDSIDLDRAFDRVDINRILQRVDLKDLVDRAEIPAIVARSTSGVFSPIVDAYRSQLVVVDQAFQVTGCRRKNIIPPAPGRPRDETFKFPKGGGNIAMAVQERYAGTFSRALAFLLDQTIISALFFFVVKIIEFAVEIVTHQPASYIHESSWGILIIFFMWQFLYYASALAATSKTLGKVVLGLKVVNNADGTPVTATRAIIRTLFLHLNIWSIVGVLCGVIRKDRREFHDIIAGTGVVYSWDAGMARYRQKVMDESHLGATADLTNNSSTSAFQSAERSTERRTLFYRRTKKAKPVEIVPEINPMCSNHSLVMHL